MQAAESKHPDLFSPDEAAAYLHLSLAQMETVEREFGLKGHKVGRATVYWRRDLDATAYRIVGLNVPQELRRDKELRIAK